MSAFWQKLFQGAKPGALFLYDDNGHAEFNEYFDMQWKGAGLTCLALENNVRFTPRYSEQKSEVKGYTTKFNHSPKLQAWVSYRLLRKDK